MPKGDPGRRQPGTAAATAAPVPTPSLLAAALDVSGAPAPERTIGSLLRELRSLGEAQIEAVLRLQHEQGLRFGDAALALRLVSREDVQWALSRQFQYPHAASHGAGAGASVSPELVVATDPFGAQAELFRDLRSQLLAGALSPGEPRAALAVLSADRGDGRTYVAANLAIALSQLGQRVLLIDADLRMPRQDRLFDLGPVGHGLSAVLAGRAGIDVVQPVAELPSLFLLPVGAPPPNPGELVQRAGFGMLLRELLQRFDHVLVDTHAAAQAADARVIAAQCGAALVLGRRHHTAVKSLQHLLKSLARTQVRSAGVLMNAH